MHLTESRMQMVGVGRQRQIVAEGDPTRADRWPVWQRRADLKGLDGLRAGFFDDRVHERIHGLGCAQYRAVIGQWQRDPVSTEGETSDIHDREAGGNPSRSSGGGQDPAANAERLGQEASPSRMMEGQGMRLALHECCAPGSASDCADSSSPRPATQGKLGHQ
jgi:hypothetical protein